MDLRGGDHFDRYLVESVIGRGGMGVVYLARDERLERRVALKVLSPELASDESFRNRFESEARIAASLDDPHVIPIYEAGEHEGQLYLAMRYVAGFDLETLIRRHGALPAERAVAIVEQLAGALATAHAAGLIHRDVKPANVLVATSASGSDHVYLTDFGLARTGTGRRLTRTGQFVGSLEYAAPEQIENGPIDARTDIYALGCVLFACLTGTPPFEAENDAALLFAHLRSEPPAPSSRRSGIPKSLDAVLARAMAKQPANRFAAATELARAARSALGTASANITTAGGTSPADSSTTSVRKTVSVVVVGLNHASESFVDTDPETVGALWERAGALAAEVAARHGGSVESFAAGSTVLVFGVPELHEDDALRAVRAALAITRGVASIPSLKIGIGISTGEVVVGGPAPGQLLVMGDVVGGATRLENAAGPGEILLSEATYRLVRDVALVDPPREIEGGGRRTSTYRLQRLESADSRRRTKSRLVGRDAQLARLLAEWHDAVNHRSPRLVTLVGPAGIGKSRLAYALAETIEGRAVFGRCLPYGDGVTYWPIREIILSVAGITDSDAMTLAKSRVAELLAGDPQGAMLADLVATAIGVGQAEAPQSEVFWSVRRLLEDLARNQQTLVVIEDLEWAEDTLLDLIEYVVDLATDAPTLIVTTGRPELLERRPGWSTNRDNAQLIRIEPLATSSTLDLVRAQPGGSVLPAALAQRIADTTEGNPLFVEEIVGALRDSPNLSQVAGNWEFKGNPEVIAIPPTIRAVLAARIERLPPLERVALERAAVIGRNFETDALRELMPEGEHDALPDRLRSLVRRELIQPDRAELSAGDAFRFRHILVRDAAYGSLPKSERAALHTAFARWLARASGDRIDEYSEIIGYHLAEAFDYRASLGQAADPQLAIDAARHLRSAGDRASSRGDLVAAAKLLGRAAGLLPPDHFQRDEILVSLGEVQRAVGEFAAARSTLDEVVSGVASSSAARLRAEVELLLVDLQTANPSLALDDERLAQLAQRVEATHDDQTLAMWSMARGTMDELEGRTAGAAQAFSDALRYAERADYGRVRTEALSRVLLNELLGTTPVAAVISRCEEVLAGSNEPHVVASALDSYSLALAMAGRAGDAVSAEERALRIASDLDDRLDEGLYRGQTLVAIHALAGDLEQAEAQGVRGCQLLVAIGAQAWLASAACVLGEVELALGRLDESRRWLGVAEEASVKTDLDARTRASVLRARLCLLDGQTARAQALISAAHEAADGTELLYLRGIVAAADACVAFASAREAEARELLTSAADLHERKGDLARARRAHDLATEPSGWPRVALV